MFPFTNTYSEGTVYRKASINTLSYFDTLRYGFYNIHITDRIYTETTDIQGSFYFQEGVDNTHVGVFLYTRTYIQGWVHQSQLSTLFYIQTHTGKVRFTGKRVD